MVEIDTDANRQPLYDIDKIAAGIFGRKQTKQRSRGAREVFDGSFPSAIECIGMHAYGLARPHKLSKHRKKPGRSVPMGLARKRGGPSPPYAACQLP